MEPRTCEECGRREDDPVALLTWSSASQAGRPCWFCAGCSRTHLRAMEARLDRAWW